MAKIKVASAQKLNLQNPLSFVAALAGSLLFEGAGTLAAKAYFYDGQGKAGIAALALHCMAAGCFMVYRLRQAPHKEEEDQSYGDGYYHRLFAMLVFFLPVIGSLGSLATFVSARSILKRQGLAESYEEGFKMEDDPLFLEETSANLIQDEISIEPIVDILNGDDVALKRGCISLLRKMKTRRAVELLKKCLSDASPEVRFYAHTALTRIESDFAGLIKDAQERYDTEGTPYAGRALARVYRRYAASGLPEDTMLMQNMKDARKLYEKALDADPDDSRLMLTLGNLCAEMKDYMASEKYFRMAVDSAGCQLEAGLGICRALYETGRIKELGKFSKRLREMPHPHSLSPEKQAVYDLWVGPETSAESNAGAAS